VSAGSGARPCSASASFAHARFERVAHRVASARLGQAGHTVQQVAGTFAPLAVSGSVPLVQVESLGGPVRDVPAATTFAKAARLGAARKILKRA
jgi:hypothetical protein